MKNSHQDPRSTVGARSDQFAQIHQTVTKALADKNIAIAPQNRPVNTQINAQTPKNRYLPKVILVPACGRNLVRPSQVLNDPPLTNFPVRELPPVQKASQQSSEAILPDFAVVQQVLK